jgi:hypothetical protein
MLAEEEVLLVTVAAQPSGSTESRSNIIGTCLAKEKRNEYIPSILMQLPLMHDATVTTTDS